MRNVKEKTKAFCVSFFAKMSPPSALWGSALVPHISVRSPRGSAVVHPAPPPAPPSLLSQPGASSFGAPNISAGSTSPSASTIHGHTPRNEDEKRKAVNRREQVKGFRRVEKKQKGREEKRSREEKGRRRIRR